MRILLAAVCCFTVWATSAQTQNTIPLSKLIDHLEGKSSVEFSYDPAIADQIAVPDNYTDLPLQDVLFVLNASYPLAVKQVSEQFYSLAVKEATYTIALTDVEDDMPVAPDLVTVVVNGTPISAEQSGTELNFTLKPSAADSIAIYALGYEVADITIGELLTGLYLKVPVRPVRIELSGVTIHDYLTKGIDINPANQSIAIAVGDLPLLPGETDGDLFASLVALPGITTPDNRPGNLFIRGSSTDQSLITVDDIPIYHRGHYFGTISPYNPKIVDQVEVYRNGFHPRSGGRVGGAVAIKTNEATDHPAFGGGIGTNTLYASAYLHTPISERFGLKVGARRSYPRSFNSPKLNAISHMIFAASALRDTSGNIHEDLEVLFEDFNATVSFKPNNRNLITATGLYTFSGIEYYARRHDTQEESQIENIGLNVNWKHLFSQKLSSETSVTLSDYDFAFRNGDALHADPPPINGPSVYALNEIRDLTVLHELDWNVSQLSKLQVGASYAYQSVDHRYKSFGPRANEPILDDGEQQGHTLSTFANWEWAPGKKWFVQLGSRLNYYSPLSRVDFAPRAFANYYATNALTFKGSMGQYYQYLSQVKGLEYASGGFDNELWRLADGENGQVIDGQQAMLGAIWHKNKWTVDVEAYAKSANNVTQYSEVRILRHGFYLTADYETRGVDLFIKRAIGEAWNLWGGYSYSRMHITLDTAKTTYDQKYSQPHVIYLGGSWQHNRWKASAGWRYASGLKGHNVYFLRARKIYNRNRQQGGPNAPTGPNPFERVPERYAPVHFLDLSASYTIPKTAERGWSMSFGLSVINLYNQQNLTDEVIRGGGTRNSDLLKRQAMDFAPNLMVMIEW
ncbi:TonB-dependent receptor plug domain-containing protein [Marinoscillum furvescens]|uniref:Outer membrane receptor for ferrienterochelin and colicin n=1 Tax=Marinoscillum furvescens DSM 4134 TaxID=1122208 RepID=A0A3D9KYN5_MARFU|nr:TonB-dependent receptor plug domain-containing protein [Marinoscillum furvescens]RED91493.1 outer membrane receptor for ferrienterochelin and colicin [Marinoscillum furvescens DSM 4134]